MISTFGEYIRALRKKEGLTLTQLAAKLELDSANLSKIENNKRLFDSNKLVALADIFQLDIKELENEFISDQLGKKMYELNCSKELIELAEEKANYRRNLDKK